MKIVLLLNFVIKFLNIHKCFLYSGFGKFSSNGLLFLNYIKFLKITKLHKLKMTVKNLNIYMASLNIGMYTCAYSVFQMCIFCFSYVHILLIQVF